MFTVALSSLFGTTVFIEILEDSQSVRSIWLPLSWALFPLQQSTTACPLCIHYSKSVAEGKSQVQTAHPNTLNWGTKFTNRPWTWYFSFYEKIPIGIHVSIQTLSIWTQCSPQTLKYTALGVTLLKPNAKNRRSKCMKEGLCWDLWQAQGWGKVDYTWPCQ